MKGECHYFAQDTGKGFHRRFSGIESTCQAGDTGSIPELGRPHGEGNGNPLQYSYLENPMDRGAWQATVHGVSKSRTMTKLQASLSPLYNLYHICSPNSSDY